ncbi:nitrite/sulfite reductase [Hydrogeniiclostridium mannosilyticum]|uniref:nitrite/sulfite reductase n=1 Tax=Hydrogeniiclostridium mannosilyticum TaxID=2764322 RepID=UPI00399A95AC
MREQWMDRFMARISDFEEKLEAFNKGEIDRKAYKGFSGGFGSYAQRDPAKNMLRLRLPGGRLTKERLGFIAGTVEQYGIDLLKLTTCETVQLHNLAPEQVAKIMEAAAEAGIYTLGGGGDNPRNVMCSPLSGVQQGEAFDVMPYAEAATGYLLSIADSIHMPRKLKVAFSNGAEDSVHAAFRDMGFLANPDGTFDLYIAGGLGANHKMGILAQQAVPAEKILYYIKAMVLTFCAHGNYENRARARTRYMQETLGEEKLRRIFLEYVSQVQRDEKLDLHVEAVDVQKSGEGMLEDARVTAQKQHGLYAVRYQPVGGCLPPERLPALYRLIKDFPAVECRVAPDEGLYIIHLTADEARKVLELTKDGAQNEFEKSVACIGASICQQGVRNSQATLAAVVEKVRERHFRDGVLPRIRISGCPSSCGAHQAAALGFQGCVKTVDKKPLPAYRLFINGTDKLGAASFGEPAGVMLESDIPAFLLELGELIEFSHSTWAEWAPQNSEKLQALAARYCA